MLSQETKKKEKKKLPTSKVYKDKIKITSSEIKSNLKM